MDEAANPCMSRSQACFSPEQQGHAIELQSGRRTKEESKKQGSRANSCLYGRGAGNARDGHGQAQGCSEHDRHFRRVKCRPREDSQTRGKAPRRLCGLGFVVAYLCSGGSSRAEPCDFGFNRRQSRQNTEQDAYRRQSRIADQETPSHNQQFTIFAFYDPAPERSGRKHLSPERLQLRLQTSWLACRGYCSMGNLWLVTGWPTSAGKGVELAVWDARQRTDFGCCGA